MCPPGVGAGQCARPVCGPMFPPVSGALPRRAATLGGPYMIFYAGSTDRANDVAGSAGSKATR